MKIILHTENLYLREMTPDDGLLAFELNSDPLMLQYTGDEAFKSIEEATTFLSNYKDYKKYGFGRWAVIDKASDEFLGWCGLKYVEENDEIDLGYRLFRKHWNKGIATESGRACLAYGFRDLNIKEIVGRVMKKNEASTKVLLKCGFTFWKDFDFDGQEGEVYRITKEDFNSFYQ